MWESDTNLVVIIELHQSSSTRSRIPAHEAQAQWLNCRSCLQCLADLSPAVGSNLHQSNIDIPPKEFVSQICICGHFEYCYMYSNFGSDSVRQKWMDEDFGKKFGE